MKIITAGTGAMGSHFRLMLHQAGNNIILVDGWPEHIEAIGKNGLVTDFNGEVVTAKVPTYPQTEVASIDSTADLVILLTEAMQLTGMLETLEHLLNKNTKVLYLLNGVGHEDIIKKYMPYGNILLGNTMWVAELEGPGKVKLFGNNLIDLQSLGTQSEQAAKAVIRVLDNAGLNARYSENILSSIYKKACVNGIMNSLCTLLNCNMTDFSETEQTGQIAQQIVNEFLAAAEAEQVTLDKRAVLQQIRSCYNRETIGLHRPSIYQDLIISHRLAEVDYINGAIVRKGKVYGIATPYCQFLTELIHCKENLLHAK